MTAVEEDCVNLAGKANVAVVESFLFLLEKVGQLVYLLLQSDHFLAKECVVLPPEFRDTPTVH